MKHKINIFHTAAVFLCDRWLQKREKKATLLEGFQLLYYKQDQEKKYFEFMVQKWEIILTTIFVGVLISLMLTIQTAAQKMLLEGNIIERNKVGKGKKEVSLVAKSEGIEGEVVLNVEAQAYKTEELEQLFMDMLRILDQVILGENESADKILTNLNLVNEIDGFPFQIMWKSENYNVIGETGNINNDKLEEQELVQLTAEITHQDYKQEYIFTVMVYPKIRSSEEQFMENLKEQLISKEIDSREYKQYVLPKEMNQMQIIWKEKKEKSSIGLFILSILAAVLIGTSKEKELLKQVEKRKLSLIQCYPDIVSKLTLLIGAGMTLQGAIGKIVCDYSKRREKSNVLEYAYEELLILSNEIKMGMSETTAYLQFGKRCRLQSYKKLSTLLNQSLKKGSGNLLVQLENETKSSLEEKKLYAKKKGEEASTKMLGPMMLMLFIVMIIIMVPAFGSFSM